MNYYYNRDPSYLSHYGVLGMKWGQRRYQNRDGSWTAEGLKRRKEDPNFKVIDPGAHLYRVSTVNNDKGLRGRLYVSTTKEDHDKWKRFYGTYAPERDLKDAMYKTKRRLVIANNDDVAKVFTEKVQPKLTYKIDEPYAALKYTVATRGAWGFFTKDTLDTPAYMASKLVSTDHPDGQKVIKALRKAGYDGMQDYNGLDVAKDPIILFRPPKNVAQVKIKDINVNELKKFTDDEFESYPYEVERIRKLLET